MAQWSIEQELCKAAKTDDVGSALLSLRLLPEGGRLLSLQCRRDWFRSGAESYLYDFVVEAIDGGRREVVIKAYVPSSTGVPLEVAFQELIRRRHLLESQGVRAPHLFYAGEGVCIEEFIPHAIADWLVRDDTSESARLSVLTDMFRVASALDRLGFAAVAPFDDLRTDGAVAYFIDFGSDLGGSGVCRSDNHHLAMLHEWIRTTAPDIPALEIYSAQTLAGQSPA